MDSHSFWKNLTMYNDNVLKWCGSNYDDIDVLIDEDEEIIVYDDAGEWYNIDESEADV